MRAPTRYVLAATTLVGSLWLAGCGDDDDGGATADPVAEATDDGSADDGSGDDGAGDGSAGDGDGDDGGSGDGEVSAGTLVFGGEEIELGSGLCFLEEQPAAAGGGSILATAQARGTNAAGEQVNIDFTRFSEESQFAGDDVSVDIGPLGESTNYRGSEPEGTVSIDGNIVSATDFPVLSSEDGSETTATFTISC